MQRKYPASGEAAPETVKFHSEDHSSYRKAVCGQPHKIHLIRFSERSGGRIFIVIFRKILYTVHDVVFRFCVICIFRIESSQINFWTAIFMRSNITENNSVFSKMQNCT